MGRYSKLSDRSARWHAKRDLKESKVAEREIRMLNNPAYRSMSLAVAAHQLAYEEQQRIAELERKRYLHPDVKTDSLYQKPSELEQILRKLTAVGIAGGFALASGAAVVHQKENYNKFSSNQHINHNHTKELTKVPNNQTVKYQSQTPVDPDVPERIVSSVDKDVAPVNPKVEGKDVFYQRVEAVYSDSGSLEGYYKELRVKDTISGSDRLVDDYFGYTYDVNSKYIVTEGLYDGEPVQIFDKDTHALIKSLNLGLYTEKVVLDKIQKDNLLVVRLGNNNHVEFVKHDLSTDSSSIIKTLSSDSFNGLVKISNGHVAIGADNVVIINPDGSEINADKGQGSCLGLKDNLVFTQLTNDYFAISNTDGGYYEEYGFPYKVHDCDIIDSNTLDYHYNKNGIERFGMFFLNSEKAFNYPMSGFVKWFETLNFQDNHLVWEFTNNKENGVYYKDLTNLLTQWDQTGKNHQITANDISLSSTTLLDYNSKEPLPFILDAMVGTDRDGKLDISKELFTLTTPDSVSSAKLLLGNSDNSDMRIYDMQETGSNPGQKVFGGYVEIETDSTLAIYLKELGKELLSNTDPVSAGVKATISGSLETILSSEWQGKEVKAVILDGKVIDIPNYKLTKINDAEAWDTKTEEFRVHSPVDMNIKQNGHIVNYDDNVVYSGPDAEPEWVFISHPSGNYDVELVGTDNGDYDYFHFVVDNGAITKQDIKKDVPIKDGDIYINGKPQSSLNQLLGSDFNKNLILMPVLGAGGILLGFMGYRKRKYIRKSLKNFFGGHLNNNFKHKAISHHTPKKYDSSSNKQDYQQSVHEIDDEIYNIESRLAEIDAEQSRKTTIMQKRQELAQMERTLEAEQKRQELKMLQDQLAEQKRQELKMLQNQLAEQKRQELARTEEALRQQQMQQTWQQGPAQEQYYPQQSHMEMTPSPVHQQRRRRTQRYSDHQWGDNEWDY